MDFEPKVVRIDGTLPKGAITDRLGTEMTGGWRIVTCVVHEGFFVYTLERPTESRWRYGAEDREHTAERKPEAPLVS